MRSMLTWVALVVALAGCASVPDTPRLLALHEGRAVAKAQATCEGRPAPVTTAVAADGRLPSRPLRVLSWNVYKGQMAGWDADLARYAAEHDLLLLQEAVLTDDLRRVIEGAGLRWQMAGAFAVDGIERGVLLAARSSPGAVCTVRTFEPLLPLPKSALVAYYALAGSDQLLLVANLHGVNFELGAGRFREQIESVASELAAHRGPLIFAGDFNAWNEARQVVLADVVQRLGLTQMRFTPDRRRLAFGRHLDQFYVRGLRVREASSPEVHSSDHNPMLVVLDDAS